LRLKMRTKVMFVFVVKCRSVFYLNHFILIMYLNIFDYK
jgi:hypothetical protein